MNYIRHIIIFVMVFIAKIQYAQFCFNYPAGNSQGTSGSLPLSICSGDFNMDGNKDIAVANYSSNAVCVRLGNSTGTFATMSTYATGQKPSAIISGDFNNDGAVDLATANFGSNDISILLGGGTGTFGIASSFSVGNNPVAISKGDFNSDSNLDLAVANYSSNTTSILLGNGTGSFSLLTSLTNGNNPVNILIDDFNTDGIKDLVIANFNSLSVTLFTGLGTGFFNSGINVLTGPLRPNSLCSGDFNNDGKRDLGITYEAQTYYMGYNISVMNGNGLGAFTATINLKASITPTMITSKDLNNDGKEDLVIVNNESCDVSVFLNSGASTFSMIGSFLTEKYPTSLVIDDYNNDSFYDIIVSNSNSNSVTVLLGKGDGFFRSAMNYIGDYKSGRIKSADFNNDGKIDVAFVNQTGYLSPGYIVYLGDGKGYFNLVGVNSLSGALDLTSGDFNNDGNMDLVVTSGNNLSVLLGNGTGTFPIVNNISLASLSGYVVSSDFNNDGNLDVALEQPNAISVMLGNGTGGLSLSTTKNFASSICSMIETDINNDGNSDIVAATSNSIATVIGNGTGNFSNPVYYSTGAGCGELIYDDFNSDGNCDLLKVSSGVHSIIIGNGTGSFTNTVNYFNGGGSGPCVSFDIDKDGKKDLAFGDYVLDRLYFYKGGGNATFTLAPTSRPLYWDPVCLIADDFNKDGALDLVCSNSGSSNFTILLNSTAIIKPSPSAICSGNPTTLKAPKNAFSYLWQPSGSKADTLLISSPGTYSLTITDLIGNCTTTTSILVNSVVNPTVSVSASNTLICSGQTSTLTAGGALTYSWSTSSTNTSIAVSPTVNTNYTVTGTDANGCTNSSIITQSVSTCASVSSLLRDQEKIKVFPNPFNDKITITMYIPLDFPFQIYNSLGAQIYSGRMEKGKAEIDLNNQPAGIYFIKAGSSTKKIIKQ